MWSNGERREKQTEIIYEHADGAIFCFYIATNRLSGTNPRKRFVLTASRDQPIAVINSPLTNNHPEIALFVNRVVRDNERVDAEPIGVRYLRGKWRIENLNGKPIKRGSKYNVLALPQDHPSVYIHQNKNRGQINVYSHSYYTTLHHPKLDRKPNALFHVTARRVEGGDSPKNAHSIGTYYHNGNWRIYNKDRQRMPANVIFNIFFGEIDFEAISAVNSRIQQGRTLMLPDQYAAEDTLFVTQRNLNEPVAGSEYSDENVVFLQWRDLGGNPLPKRWHILSQKYGGIDQESVFSVYRHSQLSTSPRYRLYKFDESGISREYATHPPLLMYDPSKIRYGRLAILDQVDFNNDGDISFTEARSPSSTRPTGFSYIHRDGKSASKFLKAKDGVIIGRFTVSEQNRLNIQLDFNQDGIIDYIEFYDGIDQSLSLLVLESEFSLKNFHDVLAGNNIFCQYESGNVGLPGNTAPSSQYGIGANTKSVMVGCNEQGIFSGGGMPYLDVGSQIGAMGSAGSTFIDQLCAAHSDISREGGSSLVSTDPTPPAATGGGVASNDDIEEYGDDALIEAGETIMATGGAASAAGQPVGGVVFLVGAFVKGLGHIWRASYNASRDPGGGSDTPPPNDWSEFCEDRAQNAGAWALSNLDKAVSQNDCPSPVEDVSGIAMSTGGNGPRPPSVGPYQPRSPQTLAGTKFCQNHNQHDSFADVWESINEGQCESPAANSGQSGRCKDPIRQATIAGSLDIGAGDVLAPEFTQHVRELLEKVVNPGEL